MWQCGRDRNTASAAFRSDAGLLPCGQRRQPPRPVGYRRGADARGRPSPCHGHHARALPSCHAAVERACARAEEVGTPISSDVNQVGGSYFGLTTTTSAVRCAKDSQHAPPTSRTAACWTYRSTALDNIEAGDSQRLGDNVLVARRDSLRSRFVGRRRSHSSTLRRGVRSSGRDHLVHHRSGLWAFVPEYNGPTSRWFPRCGRPADWSHPEGGLETTRAGFAQELTQALAMMRGGTSGRGDERGPGVPCWYTLR